MSLDFLIFRAHLRSPRDTIYVFLEHVEVSVEEVILKFVYEISRITLRSIALSLSSDPQTEYRD
jgi:hypothetical protein